MQEKAVTTFDNFQDDLSQLSVSSSDAVPGQSALQDVLCSVCLEIPQNPQECRDCRGNFCSKCLTDWKQKSKTCPNQCAEPSYVKPHPFFLRSLHAIKIKCRFCAQETELEFSEKHMKECLEREVLCLLCQKSVKMKNQGSHRKECRVTTCEKCGAERTEKDHDCVAYLKQKCEGMKKEYEERINSEVNSKQALKTQLNQFKSMLQEHKAKSVRQLAKVMEERDTLAQRVKVLEGQLGQIKERIEQGLKMRCPKGHKMVKLTKGQVPMEYLGGFPFCDRCQSKKIHVLCSFYLHCLQCGYDVCEACVAQIP